MWFRHRSNRNVDRPRQAQGRGERGDQALAFAADKEIEHDGFTGRQEVLFVDGEGAHRRLSDVGTTIEEVGKQGVVEVVGKTKRRVTAKTATIGGGTDVIEIDGDIDDQIDGGGEIEIDAKARVELVIRVELIEQGVEIAIEPFPFDIELCARIAVAQRRILQYLDGILRRTNRLELLFGRRIL